MSRFARRLPLLLMLMLLVLGGAAGSATPVAFAAPAIPLTPLLDCVVVSGTGANETVTAYFGYSNTGTSVNFNVGSYNELYPGLQDQGQPVTFSSGTYPVVFSATFAPSLVPTLHWELNSVIISVTDQSPSCSFTTTAPASDVAATAATLNGVVAPGGYGTSYHFEYGTTASYGTSTPAANAGSGTTPVLEQAPLTGLQPSTTYYYRLVAASSAGTSDGAQQSFTTTSAGSPAGGLTISTSSLPVAMIGHWYRAKLAASGGTPPYTWHVIRGHLPSRLRLDSATGVIRGTVSHRWHRRHRRWHWVSRFTVSVTDSAIPQATKDVTLTITIEWPHR